MARGPIATERLVSDAFAALTGAGDVDAHAAQQALANAAKALARALPVCDLLYDPALDGPPMLPEEIKAAAVDARSFLRLVADLLGSPGDPDWMGEDFAFSVTLKRRPDWNPPAELTAAQRKRLAAAARVYELMAASYFDNGQPPKQEAAISGAMQEFGLARSKVMQGLKEYRQSKCWLQSCSVDDAGEWRVLPVREQLARVHQMLAQHACEREWFRRNPDAHFVGVPASCDLDKELLSRESPCDRPD